MNIMFLFFSSFYVAQKTFKITYFAKKSSIFFSILISCIFLAFYEHWTCVFFLSVFTEHLKWYIKIPYSTNKSPIYQFSICVLSFFLQNMFYLKNRSRINFQMERILSSVSSVVALSAPENVYTPLIQNQEGCRGVYPTPFCTPLS